MEPYRLIPEAVYEKLKNVIEKVEVIPRKQSNTNDKIFKHLKSKQKLKAILFLDSLKNNGVLWNEAGTIIAPIFSCTVEIKTVLRFLYGNLKITKSIKEFLPFLVRNKLVSKNITAKAKTEIAKWQRKK